MSKKIITAALPYANGSIHIGHLLEYIQADIYARFLKLQGKDALYICASDMHGTPIEVNASKAGIPPDQFVNQYWQEHQQDFASFLIHFDNYYKTHSPENKELADFFYNQLKKKKLIYRKKIPIIYCSTCQRSLPDRFVRGTCPHCHVADQYGDVCEKCNKTLKGIDLLQPYCTICNQKPQQKESEHYFFKLSSFQKPLQRWINAKKSAIQPEVRNWLREWLQNLDDWCVSRDAPYYGFEIPNSHKETGETKYFYVWLDAPIGYISSTKQYCQKRKLNWKDYWYKGEVHQFLGKDIAYFHFLFWPAMLLAVGIPLPHLTVHGFITIDGQKMSKSRGTFFTAKDFYNLYGAEPLRFYYAAHLDRKLVDVDLSLSDLQAVTNNVLMGNLGNFCYRTLTFAHKNYAQITEITQPTALKKEIQQLIKEIKTSYAALDFKNAVKCTLKIADLGNAYFQQAEPWKNKEKTQKEVAFCINLTRNLAIICQPVLPDFSQKIFTALQEKNLSWKDISFTWKGKVKPVDILVNKIEHLPASFPIHMKVGKIVQITDHPNADKLYVLKVDFASEQRQIVAGLKTYFSKDQILNRHAVFCVNLKPANLRGQVSQGMTLMAEDDENHLAFLDPGKTPVGEDVSVEGFTSIHTEITFDELTKYPLRVEKGLVKYEGKVLRTSQGSIKVVGVKDGAMIR